MICINNVTKVYEYKKNTVNALKDVSIEIDDGDVFGIIGFSGAGKSTLVRTINALELPTSGEVYVNEKNVNRLKGESLRKIRKSIGMIFQQFNLLESKTVYQNVAIPLILNHTPKDEIRKRVNELLEFVELSDKIDVYTNKLSGGQKQRVAIARALTTNPSILLCDEATSALDPKTTDSILELLSKVNKEFGVTIVLITHEMHVIQKICNKVAVMDNGAVIEQGSVVDIFVHSRNPVTKNFVRTAINEEIPDKIKEYIKLDDRNNIIVKLKFLGSNTKDSLLSYLNKNYNVETNILFATVNEIYDTVLGILIVQIVGEQKTIDAVLEYISSTDIECEKEGIA